MAEAEKIFGSALYANIIILGAMAAVPRGRNRPYISPPVSAIIKSAISVSILTLMDVNKTF
jgi:hypothetical protein